MVPKGRIISTLQSLNREMLPGEELHDPGSYMQKK